MTGDPHMITFDKNNNVSQIVDKACGSNIIVRPPTSAHNRLGMFFVCDTNTFVFASDVTHVTQLTSINNNNDNLAVSVGNSFLRRNGVFHWTVLVSIVMILMFAH